MRRTLGAALSIVFALGVLTAPNSSAATRVYNLTAEIWADNWFALYVNGKKVGEDSTAFATERSFNSDAISFKASYPLTIGIMARDYVENASGLEWLFNVKLDLLMRLHGLAQFAQRRLEIQDLMLPHQSLMLIRHPALI